MPDWSDVHADSDAASFVRSSSFADPSSKSHHLLPQETTERDQEITHCSGEVVLRPMASLHAHPAYLELGLAVSLAQFAALRHAGPLALKDPLLVTRQGVLIDGYARKEYANTLGISALPCVELEVNDEEALQLILNKHRRSHGWNDFNRIRLAFRLTGGFRELARSNQCEGGHLKGSSNLTEVSVRKAIANAAGVSEGNVTKVGQLLNSEPQILDALAKGEIRIHRAWLWRRLCAQQQREALRVYRLERALKRPAKILAFKHRANGPSLANTTLVNMANLEQLLNELLSTQPAGSESPDSIAVGVINLPGKAALMTSELYEKLLRAGV